MKKILIILFASFLLASCEEMLIEEPKSISSDVFYNTPKEVESALAAIYSAVRAYGCMGGDIPGST